MIRYRVTILCRKMAVRTSTQTGLPSFLVGKDFLDFNEVHRLSEFEGITGGLQLVLKKAVENTESICICDRYDVTCRESVVSILSSYDTILTLLEKLGYCSIVSIWGSGDDEKVSSALLEDDSTNKLVSNLFKGLLDGYIISKCLNGFNLTFRSFSTTPSVMVSAALLILRVLKVIPKENLKSLSSIAHFFLANSTSLNIGISYYGMDSASLILIALFLISEPIHGRNRRYSAKTGPVSYVSGASFYLSDAIDVFEHLTDKEKDILLTGADWGDNSVFKYITHIEKLRKETK